MKLNLILKHINKKLYSFLFILVGIFFIHQFLNSFIEILGDKWAYNELFINYSAGIIRRGLLGSLFSFTNFQGCLISKYLFINLINEKIFSNAS